MGSGTADATFGLISIKGAFVVAIPGRTILKIYEVLVIIIGKLPFCTWVGGKPEMWQIVDYYLILSGAVWIYRISEKKYKENKTAVMKKERKSGNSDVYVQVWYAWGFF